MSYFSYNLPQAIVQQFIEALASGETAPLEQLTEKPAFRNKVQRLLSEFAGRYNEEFSRMALLHERSLERIKARGMDIRTIIDVGASDGQRSEMLRKNFFPKAYCFLIEGFDVWQPALENRKCELGQMDYIIAAAGEKVGDIYFFKQPDKPTQGHAYDRPKDSRYDKVAQTTIDHEVSTRGLQGPFMIKIDTHGREKEILLGAEKTLQDASLLMIEVNNFEDRGRLRFHELCAFVEERGFRCVDIAEPTFRPYDKCFWQCDLFFIKADRPEFQHRGFN